jgi:hypothetical protein
MHAEQISWRPASGWSVDPDSGKSTNLVLYFGMRDALTCGARFDGLRARFPRAHLLDCSTGGQIQRGDIIDEEIAAVALRGPRIIAVAGNRGHLWGEQHRIETRTKRNHS